MKVSGGYSEKEAARIDGPRKEPSISTPTIEGPPTIGYPPNFGSPLETFHKTDKSRFYENLFLEKKRAR